MNSKKDIRFVAAGLAIASVLGISAYFSAKISWVSELQDCGQKLASHAFKNGVQIGFGRSQVSAFAPLIDKISASGFEPEFVFRAQCGSFIAAGLKQTENPLPDVSDPLFGRRNVWLDINSVAVVYDLCVLNEGNARTKSADPCLNTTVAAAYALAFLIKDERVSTVRTALEYRTVRELIALQQNSHTEQRLASVTRDGMQQLNRFMTAFTSRTAGTPQMKRSDFLMSDAAEALAVARK